MNELARLRGVFAWDINRGSWIGLESSEGCHIGIQRIPLTDVSLKEDYK